MPALNRAEREALIAQFKELKREQDDLGPEALLDSEVRRRFGMMIHRAVAAGRIATPPISGTISRIASLRR